MTIFGYRNHATLGMCWHVERTCADAEAETWLAVLRAAEPSVKFTASHYRPHAAPLVRSVANVRRSHVSVL